jgi:hypothetical protein
MRTWTRSKLVLTTALVALSSCDLSHPSIPVDAPDRLESNAKALGPETCAFGQTFTLLAGNPYYPITAGSYWVLEGDDEGTPVRVRIDATAETEQVGGVTTRVVTETESAFDAEAGEWELVEISHNYFALTRAGTLCYFGEAVDIYQDGEVVSHEGAWRADAPGNAPGVFMPADPQPGMTFQMESAPGVAEDQGKIEGAGPITVPVATFTETIRVREFNPLDRGKGFKIFARGVGMIVDGPVELVEYSVR